MKNRLDLNDYFKLWMKSFYLFIGILFSTPIDLISQNCPNMATHCTDVPLICGLNQLNGNSNCSMLSYNDYVGDRCFDECWSIPNNTTHYAFTTDGTPFTITLNFSNCQVDIGTDKGIQLALTTSCCDGMIKCINGFVPATSISISAQLPSCQVYYFCIDGYKGTYCDYNLTVSGGAANVPLVLKNINNTPNNIINLNRGVCNYKFNVEPRDAPCEGYYEWTFDGVPVNDHDRDVSFSFPNEGDFVLCVFGYVGLPNFNCGQSNLSCTTIKVKQEHRTGDARILCNEEKGYKWFKKSINSSGTYNQEFQEKCAIYDSTIEFIFLPKPQPSIINYISCSKADPYYEPIYKDYYRNCTANKKIVLPKSTEIYACDSSFLLNVAFVDLASKFHLNCKNGNVYMIPEITDYTDTCGIGVTMDFTYAWYEKINNQTVFISQGKELKILKKGNYQLQVIANYKLGTESGFCTVPFDEDIDEDSYLQSPNTGSLNGKIDVCKGDLECYTINDIVKNPFSYTWSVDQGVIVTPNPNQSNKICVQWDKNSTMTKGQLCVTYSDSCSSNLKACLNIEFGKSQKDVAGPDQKVQGVLGTKMNAQGKKGLWTYAGGPGTVNFTDPTDPKTKARVSRFGSYTFKWTTMEDDCEVYGYVTINFYIEFPELEGEYLQEGRTIVGKDPFFSTVRANYLNDQLNIEGELKTTSKIQFQVVNIQGQLLYSEEMQTAENKFVKSLNLELSSGIYYLVLKNNSEYKINKFTVFNDH